jgi:diguanylate cyclase (GGDEF)-like protein
LALVVVGLVAATGALAARNSAHQDLANRAASVKAAWDASTATRAGRRADPRTTAKTLERRMRGGMDVRLRVGAKPPRTDAKVRSYPLAGRARAGQRLFVVLPDTSAAKATTKGALLGGITGLALVLIGFLLLQGMPRVPRPRSAPAAPPANGMDGAIERMLAGEDGARLPEQGRSKRAAESFNRLAVHVDELRKQAATDPLTGLANRRHFEQQLEVELKRAQRTSRPVALMILDFDGFKEINDAHGHPYGDEILRQVAEGLMETVRATDVLARVGGDEFAFILPEADSTTAGIVAERARVAVESVATQGVVLSCSGGIASFPRDAQDATTLAQCADGALYWAKRAGRGEMKAYDPTHVTVARSEGEKSEVAALLAQEDAITPHFQPIVALATARLAGYEALSRFPQDSGRRPDEWFAVAHRVGLGYELEAKAIAAALAVPNRPAGTYLSLNSSPSAVSSPQVQAVLPEDLSEIVIEITEHELYHDEASLREALTPLRERGARIAVDDAGAGYAGLQQLMRVQPDIIKLDRALVANVHEDPAKAALIDSFVRFARRTGAVVCAEGIEELEELRAVADLDVTYGQGYGLAKPSAPWVTVSPWVADTLRGTRISSLPSMEELDLGDFGDGRLALVCSRLAKVDSIGDLETLRTLIAAEVNADEILLLGLNTFDEALVPLGEGAWLTEGDSMRLSSHEQARMALDADEPSQLLVSDPGGGLGELALLQRSGFAAVLMVPVWSQGRAVGMMLALARVERPWTRTERNRSRVIAYQLGAALEALVDPAAGA